MGWFASYVTNEKPDLVLVVFVRPGNGHLASTIAGQVYSELYKPPAPERALSFPPLEAASGGM